MALSPLAGQPARQSDLVNVPRLLTAYFSERPDPQERSQRVSFGTSGHRGSSFHRSFNEWHILAITQAILNYNKTKPRGLADGIVVTPSHNPPEDGGFKYNPPHGGPADSQTTKFIEARANEFLERGLEGVRRVSFE